MSEGSSKSLMLAVIREAECIGCTKCIQACPVDAILGSLKQMHTVIVDECIGCKLCVEPCPVDCIDLIPMPLIDLSERKLKAQNAKIRVQARRARLKNEETAGALQPASDKAVHDKKDFIQAALLRAQAKKMNNGV